MANSIIDHNNDVSDFIVPIGEQCFLFELNWEIDKFWFEKMEPIFYDGFIQQAAESALLGTPTCIKYKHLPIV